MREDVKETAMGFALRRVLPATAAERLTRAEGMARALAFGAKPYRDAAGKGRHIPFKEANLAAVEPWVRDPRAKRGYRRTQELRKAAGQLVGQPGDKIEIAKRLGELYWEQGSDIEGAARRGLYDAIWSREHVYDTFTVPRRYGRTTLIDTGRVAAVVEEEGRKIQAEDPIAQGGFWVRDRNDFGLLYVVPNADPESAEREILGGEDEAFLIGQASTPSAPPPRKPAVRQQPFQTPASPTPPSQTPTIPSLVTQLPANPDDLFLVYRQRLAPIEGGLANRPPHEDPAGKTYKGVTQDTLDRLHQNKPMEYGHYPTDPASLSDDQIDTILRKEYFDPLHIWQVAQVPNLLKLAPQLPDQLFDIAVLHGVDFSGRVLQEAIFEVVGIDLRLMKNGKLEYDGVIGPATRNALAQAVLAGKIVELNDLIVDKRIAELNTKGHKVSNPGWFTRAESFRSPPTPRPGAP